MIIYKRRCCINTAYLCNASNYMHTLTYTCVLFDFVPRHKAKSLKKSECQQLYPQLNHWNQPINIEIFCLFVENIEIFLFVENMPGSQKSSPSKNCPLTRGRYRKMVSKSKGKRSPVKGRTSPISGVTGSSQLKKSRKPKICNGHTKIILSTNPSEFCFKIQQFNNSTV